MLFDRNGQKEIEKRIEFFLATNDTPHVAKCTLWETQKAYLATVDCVKQL